MLYSHLCYAHKYKPIFRHPRLGGVRNIRKKGNRKQQLLCRRTLMFVFLHKLQSLFILELTWIASPAALIQHSHLAVTRATVKRTLWRQWFNRSWGSLVLTCAIDWRIIGVTLMYCVTQLTMYIVFITWHLSNVFFYYFLTETIYHTWRNTMLL